MPGRGEPGGRRRGHRRGGARLGEVLRDAEAGALAPRYGPRAAFDLGEAPLPAFELLGEAPRARYTLQTARGCPLACSFCAASRVLGRFREKPAARITAELEAIRARDPRPRIELADDNTFAGGRDPAPLLGALEAAGARYFTETDWRVGERPDVLERLAASGCRQVLVGVESLVFRHPGMGAKDADLGRILAALEAIQDAGVVVNGCFVVGAEGETRASLERLAELVLASPLAEVQMTVQTPFPGSPLYRQLRRQGRLLPERGWSHYTLFDVAYRPDRLSVEELERGFADLLGRVFAPEAARARARRRRAVWRRRREAAAEEV